MIPTDCIQQIIQHNYDENAVIQLPIYEIKTHWQVVFFTPEINEEIG
jgi:hypothetical protein